jgi:hypothetical protein
MFGVAGFFGTFIDYLRPTKSPYLVVILIAVGVICFKVGVNPSNDELRKLSLPERLDAPGFFFPIFVIIFAMVPLSLIRRTKKDAEPISGSSSPQADAIANAKYENDLDGVFKFSRALCLAVAAIMLFVFYNSPLANNWYSSIGYWIIMIQLITFLSYMAFKHYAGEDVSNIGLFQISFITAVLFAGCTFLATEIRGDEGTFQYFYYCKTQNVQFVGSAGSEQYPCNEIFAEQQGKIRSKIEQYRPDFLQISFAVLLACWTVYEIFWLSALIQMATSAKGLKPTSTDTTSSSA